MVFCLLVCKSQNSKTIISLDSIISPFQEIENVKDSVSVRIEISDNPILFERKEIVLKNPKEISSITHKNLPISYSIIYQNKLVSLFEAGMFVCLSIPEMKRDIDFEKKINTKRFQYHWLLDDKLVAISEGKYYTLNTEDVWVEYTETIPLKSQPKLFEDSLYLSFCDCYGEFGGTVYFYNKKTKNIHFTSATCANTIFKENNTYFILSHLGHMSGSTELKSIFNPNELPIIEPENVNKWHSYEVDGWEAGGAWGDLDSSGKTNTIFDYHGIEIFSTFVFQGRTVYLIDLNERIFLAEIENNIIKIVSLFFNSDDIYTHNVLTTNYGEIILINLDYRAYEFSEMSCLLIYNNQLIIVDWNKKHNRFKEQ